MSNPGFSLLEVLISLGMFSVLLVTGITVTQRIQESNYATNNALQAYTLAHSGLEAVRSVYKQQQTVLEPGTYGLNLTNGNVTLTSNPDTINNFTHSLQISYAQRDSQNSLSSSGTEDTNTLLVTSLVNWPGLFNRPRSVSLETYLSNWSAYNTNSCTWETLTSVDIIDTPGNANLLSLWFADNLLSAGLTSQNGSLPELVNYTTETTPVTSISQLNTETDLISLSNLGTTLFALTDDLDNEIVAINLSDSNNPAITTTLNLPEQPTGSTLISQNNYLLAGSYQHPQGPELFLIDASNPNNLEILSDLEVDTSIRDIAVGPNNTFYLATESNNQEIMTVSITGTNQLQQQNTINLPGNADALIVSTFNQYLVVGRQTNNQAEIMIVDPNTGTTIATYELGATVTDMKIDNSVLFVSVDSNTEDVLAIDLSDLESISTIASINLANRTDQLALDRSTCTLFAGTRDNSQTIHLIQSVETPSPTPTPITTCENYCQNQGYTTGSCRPNANACTNPGGTVEPEGNQYCQSNILCCCE